MIVTISGPIGSGKTTVARAIASRFKLRHVSAGEVFRSLARERGMSLAEFSKYAEEHHEVDRLVDERQVELARQGNAVVDGRLTAWLLPEAELKIWLKAPLEVRAERVAKREGISFEQALRETKLREESEAKRYREIYGIDLGDLTPYDVVINTGIYEAEDVIEIISLCISLSPYYSGEETSSRAGMSSEGD
ncbi:MAG: AAA family ATPase [Euryarchaeota archaeon]|nr:AAA family ATPase [Euryarchaeota archaeon]